jgi:sugar phosphate isomerase/epimerase
MKIGIDSYSFHRFFGETTKWETSSKQQWTLQNFLDFVEEQGVQLASLETAYLKPDENTEKTIGNWLKVPGREVVFTWGHPNGFDGGKKPEALKDALDFLHLAHSLGIAQMRIVCGNHWNFSTDPSERFELLKPLITELLKEATRYGILISIENHADFPVQTLMQFIESFDNPNLGLCLDLGNALRVGDDPVTLLHDLNVERIFMIQVKDVLRIEGHEDPTGWWPTVLHGTGDINLEACLQLLKINGYRNPIVVELSNLYSDLTEVEVAKQAVVFLRNELASGKTERL